MFSIYCCSKGTLSRETCQIWSSHYYIWPLIPCTLFFLGHTIVSQIYIFYSSNSNNYYKLFNKHMPIIFNQPETSTSHPADRPPWFWTDPFFFLTAYINTSQLISNTTIPNDKHVSHTAKPETAKAENRSS